MKTLDDAVRALISGLQDASLASSYQNELALTADLRRVFADPPEIISCFGRAIRPDLSVNKIPVEVKLLRYTAKYGLNDDGTFVAAIQSLLYALCGGHAIVLLVLTGNHSDLELIGEQAITNKFLEFLSTNGVALVTWSLGDGSFQCWTHHVVITSDL